MSDVTEVPAAEVPVPDGWVELGRVVTRAGERLTLLRMGETFLVARVDAERFVALRSADLLGVPCVTRVNDLRVHVAFEALSSRTSGTGDLEMPRRVQA